MKKETPIDQVDYRYNGPGSRKAYFEGWYFKLRLDKSSTVSLIPSLHKQGSLVYASLQWILVNGDKVTTGSKTYTKNEFTLSKAPFRLVLGKSSFAETGIHIEEAELGLTCEFLTVAHYQGDMMGPFRRLQRRMPCNHGLLVTHGLANVTIRSESLSGQFDAGLYVEKDWGDTFPKRYIWLQADFPEQNAYFFFSVADVSVGPVNFTGFIANFTLNGIDHTFATWNLAYYKVSGDETDIRIAVGDFDLKIAVQVLPKNSVHLNSPVQGIMNATIRESISAPLHLKVRDSVGDVANYFTDMASVECHNWFSSEKK